MSDTWEYGDAKYEKAKGRRLQDKITDKVAQKKSSATEVFRMFDKDHNGSLSRPELLMGLNELGFYPNTREWKHVLSKVDINRDGHITFDEFHQALVMHDFDPELDNKALGNQHKTHRARRDNLGVNMFALGDAWEGVRMQKKKGIFSPIRKDTLGLTPEGNSDSYFQRRGKKIGGGEASIDHLNEKEVYGMKKADEIPRKRTMILNSSRELVPVHSRKELFAQRHKENAEAAWKCQPAVPQHHGAYRSSQFTKTGDLRFPQSGVDLVHLQKTLLDARMIELNKTSDNLLNAMKGRGCA